MNRKYQFIIIVIIIILYCLIEIGYAVAKVFMLYVDVDHKYGFILCRKPFLCFKKEEKR
jgi:hypothetical protein